MHRLGCVLALFGLGGLAGGCTYHPPGERQERVRAGVEGGRFAAPAECRPVPALSESPSPDDLVRYALLASPQVEVAYWEWRAAIERVPQAGTPGTTLAAFGSVGLKGEGSAWDRTTLGLQNDPMFNLPPPSRIRARARKALEEARAAGLRFEQVKWELRRKVLEAYFDYLLVAESARIADLDVGQWELTVSSVEGRVEAGAVGQHGLLVARTSLDLARSDAATLRSRLPARLAAVNALLSRPLAAPLGLPSQVPEGPVLVASDEQILADAARTNPGLGALDAQWRARLHAVSEARTGFLPELSLSGSITGDVARTVGGMVTLPFVRREAICAALEEARAEVRASEARRREASNDLAARVVSALASIRDADRRISLFQGTVVPRAEQAVELARTGYTVERSTYLEIRDAARTLLDSRKTLLEIRVERARTAAEIEAMLGRPFATAATTRSAGESKPPENVPAPDAPAPQAPVEK
jgi:cobalt-zinc-cadmium efflux system outer membrane protein